ncbi:MAG: hypothetical protein SFV15_27150 [Polyangiaceae bacterium]|nr:hypothetical protein [Polyangiaceae bacterium]
MAKQDSSAMWVAGGLAALGLLALAGSSREPARRSFDNALRDELRERGFRLVSAELGRRHGAPVWVVTSELPDGRMVSVDVPVEGQPYENPRRLALEISGALS